MVFVTRNKVYLYLTHLSNSGQTAFTVNENIVVTAQTNSTYSDKQKIVVTWLETNDTNTNDTPAISISDEDFWKTFNPLLEQSINGSTDSS